MCLIVAYNWNNISNAGVWNANFNNVRDNSNNNISFRSDYGSFLKPRQEDSGATGMCYPAIGEIR
jgi:hypothetical protein